MRALIFANSTKEGVVIEEKSADSPTPPIAKITERMASKDSMTRAVKKIVQIFILKGEETRSEIKHAQDQSAVFSTLREQNRLSSRKTLITNY